MARTPEDELTKTRNEQVNQAGDAVFASDHVLRQLASNLRPEKQGELLTLEKISDQDRKTLVTAQLREQAITEVVAEFFSELAAHFPDNNLWLSSRRKQQLTSEEYKPLGQLALMLSGKKKQEKLSSLIEIFLKNNHAKHIDAVAILVGLFPSLALAIFENTPEKNRETVTAHLTLACPGSLFLLPIEYWTLDKVVKNYIRACRFFGQPSINQSTVDILNSENLLSLTPPQKATLIRMGVPMSLSLLESLTLEEIIANDLHRLVFKISLLRKKMRNKCASDTDALISTVIANRQLWQKNNREVKEIIGMMDAEQLLLFLQALASQSCLDLSEYLLKALVDKFQDHRVIQKLFQDKNSQTRKTVLYILLNIINKFNYIPQTKNLSEFWYFLISDYPRLMGMCVNYLIKSLHYNNKLLYMLTKDDRHDEFLAEMCEAENPHLNKLAMLVAETAKNQAAQARIEAMKEETLKTFMP